MNKFKKNDKVYLSPDSEFSPRNTKYIGKSNPLNVIGTIINITEEIMGTLNIRVKWDNGTSNSYSKKDLIFANKKIYPDE